jgi:phage-related holin
MKRNRDKREGGNNGLRSLNLSNNKLWGEVPYTVSTLVGLTTLNLSSNTLSQQLPEVKRKKGWMVVVVVVVMVLVVLSSGSFSLLLPIWSLSGTSL